MILTPLGVSLIVLGAVAAFLYGIWLIIPILYGLPWVPTRHVRIRKALQLAQVQPGETVFDLGAGDGRVLMIAAREFRARAIGIEISPIHCFIARMSAWFNSVKDLVRIQQGDFYQADLKDADVVFAYMTSRQAVRLRPYLETQLHIGARVVTISFDFEGWQPEAVDREELIFLYRMPPVPGNVSTFLTQKYQNRQRDH